MSSTAPDVILIGASVRSLAEDALADGLRPFCVDLFADRDLTSLPCEVHVVDHFAEAAALTAMVPAHVPAIVGGGAENDRALIAAVQHQRPIAGCPLAVSADQLFPLIADAGGSVPRHAGTAASAAAQPVARWLLKSASSSGGGHVQPWSAATADGPNSTAVWPENGFLQEWLSGPVFSCTWFSTGDQPTFEGIALQLSGEPAFSAPGFSYCGNIGVPDPPPRLVEELRPVAKRLQQELGLSGFWGMDCVLHQERAHVIEVNVRLTASHELHASAGRGCVLRQLQAYGWCGATLPPSAAPPAAMRPSIAPPAAPASAGGPSPPLARLVLYAPQSLRITQKQSDALMAHRRGLSADFWCADIPGPQTHIEGGTPLCSIYFPDAVCVADNVLHNVERLLPHLSPQWSAGWLAKYQAQIRCLQQL